MLLRQALRFLTVGTVTTVIGMATVYAVLFLTGADAVTANAVGYALGLGVNFAMNRSWTFRSREQLARVIPKYAGVVAAAYALNLLTLLEFTGSLRVNAYVAQLPAMAVYTVSMFLGCRLLVFPDTRRHA